MRWNALLIVAQLYGLRCRRGGFPVRTVEVGSSSGETTSSRKNHAGRAGTQLAEPCCLLGQLEEDTMNGIIYIVGLIVVIGVVLSFFGLR